MMRTRQFGIRRWAARASCVASVCLMVGTQRSLAEFSRSTQTAGHVEAEAAPAKTTILDRIVAVVDGDPILASDVADEIRFADLQSGKRGSATAPQAALNRVIDRVLIDKQRALQPGTVKIPTKEVEKSVTEFRKRIPECAGDACKTDAEWDRVLATYGFTASEVADRIRERLTVLKFIDLRFGVVVRIPNAAVQKYYDTVLAPEMEKRNEVAPPLKAVSARIREVLRQQQVDAMVDEWLKSLHGEEQVQILDPAYAKGESGQ